MSNFTSNSTTHTTSSQENQPDFYQILGVKRDVTPKQIKLAYRKKVLLYHPDKAQNEEDKKKYEEYFELITEAYDTLKNPVKKSYYDNLSNLTQDNCHDHTTLKKSAKDYFKSLQRVIPDTQTIEAKRKELASKHVQALPAKQLAKELLTITRERAVADKKLPKKLFEAKNMPISKFNAVFEKVYRNKSKDIVSKDSIPEGIAMEGFSGNYSGFNETESITDNLLTANTNNNSDLNTKFSGLQDTLTGETDTTEALDELTEADIKDIKDVDYTTGHASERDDKEYIKSLEERMNEYQTETKKLQKMSLNNFKPTEKRYGVLSALGLGDEKSSEFGGYLTQDSETAATLRNKYNDAQQAREYLDPKKTRTVMKAKPITDYFINTSQSTQTIQAPQSSKLINTKTNNTLNTSSDNTLEVISTLKNLGISGSTTLDELIALTDQVKNNESSHNKKNQKTEVINQVSFEPSDFIQNTSSNTSNIQINKPQQIQHNQQYQPQLQQQQQQQQTQKVDFRTPVDTRYSRNTNELYEQMLQSRNIMAMNNNSS